jgi:hypothetical protein
MAALRGRALASRRIEDTVNRGALCRENPESLLLALAGAQEP